MMIRLIVLSLIGLSASCVCHEATIRTVETGLCVSEAIDEYCENAVTSEQKEQCSNELLDLCIDESYHSYHGKEKYPGQGRTQKL